MSSSDNKLDYQITKTFPVPAERLFRALTDATVLKEIWGVQRITVDARVGGTTRAVYVVAGQDWSFTLTYTEVVANRILRWRTHFKGFPTKETQVTLKLTEAVDATELRIRMENFETAEERDANREAWLRGLATLAEILGRPAAA